MVGGGFHLGFPLSKCSSHAPMHAHVFLFGLIFSHVHASTSVNCRLENISSTYQHCGIHPDGVHDLDCFRKPRGLKKCVWKPGKLASGQTYTLVVQTQWKHRKYCNSYDNITEFSEEITLNENDDNMSAQVFENSRWATNCTKAVFTASPKSLLRCGPPLEATFSRRSGRLVVDVSWPKEDVRYIKYYLVKYRAEGSLSWSKAVRSENATSCTVERLNASLVYAAQIQCVTSEKCPQCAETEAYTVPPELTAPPLNVSFEDTDIQGRAGCRLLSLTWKFPAKELHDGYYVSVGKASGEAPREWISTSRPEIRLILSYSAYRVDISARNNASTSPAVSQAIPPREDTPRLGAGRLNVTVHSDTSFTVHWRDNLIRKYVCYSVEWTKEGQKVDEEEGTQSMSFYQNAYNNRTLSLAREGTQPLEPYKRYSITLHTRPDKDTCNMKHVNNSENTYGRTQFYFTEGSPVSAPTNISSYNVTLHSVVLQWSSIPEEDIRGFLTGYTIFYNEYHHGRSSTERNITVDPVSNSCELGHLKGGTAYEVRMSGFTRAGAGVRSAASLFKTTDQGFSYLSGVITISTVVATVLIFGPPVIKRLKAILWPSIPNPGKSNAMQKIEEPCDLELLESINTQKPEEWDAGSLQVVEKEDATLASASLAMLPLLRALEDGDDSADWIRRDTEDDADGDISPNGAEETSPDIRRTDAQSLPLAFSGDYTTLDMFQQGMPPNTFVTQTAESKPEDPDLTVVKSGLDYIRHFDISPVSDCKMSTI